MYLQDLSARVAIRPRNLKSEVEASRTQERFIDHVESVGRGDHPNVPESLDAIEFSEQLTDDPVGHRRTAVEATLRRQ